MSFFRYEALDRQGKVVVGAMDAPSEAVVSARLSQMGYQPQRVLSTAPNTATAPAAAPRTGMPLAGDVRRIPLAMPARGGASAKDMALFFRQFAALIRSGISLFNALDNLSPRTPNRSLAGAGREMADAARTGGRVSDAMEKFPVLFPEHVVGAVRAGEMGGFMEIVLDEIALDYEQAIAFYRGTWLVKALVVQAAIAIAIGQPVFPDLFPPPSKWGLYIAHVFLRNVPIMLALCALAWLWLNWLQLPQNGAVRDRLALRTPVFGDLARQKALASFCRALFHLSQAGVGPIGAWEGAMHVAPNAVIRGKLIDAHEMIRRGVPLHEAFAQTGLFANETEQLLATGVYSGAVVDMLDRVAGYYHDNVERASSRARFTMFRIGITLTIILSGALLIILMKTYFASIFQYADDFEKG